MYQTGFFDGCGFHDPASNWRSLHLLTRPILHIYLFSRLFSLLWDDGRTSTGFTCSKSRIMKGPSYSNSNKSPKWSHHPHPAAPCVPVRMWRMETSRWSLPHVHPESLENMCKSDQWRFNVCKQSDQSWNNRTAHFPLPLIALRRSWPRL